MGGAGKTQIALRYGYERIQKGAEIKIAKLLELPGASAAAEQNRSLVKRWLQNSTDKHWLMILDNVEDGYHITESMPSATMGSVLITTRNEKVGFQLASNTIRVPPFTVEEGTTLLLNIIQRDSYSKEEREAASNL
ncbi:hypothetical protein ACKAV7_005157 [Fusarium commune]